MRSVLLTALLVGVVPFGSVASDGALIGNRASTFQIVPAPGSVAADLAARELQAAVREATGVELAIASQPDAGRAHILLGESEWTRERGVTAAGLRSDGFRMKTVGQDLILLGVDDNWRPEEISAWNLCKTGTLNAVYTFLDRFVGVRWYTDDELGQVVPHRDRVVIPELDETQEPSFVSRIVGYGPNIDKLFGRRNLLGGSFDQHHTHAWLYLVPPNEFGQTHPEYFALVRGERQNHFSYESYGAQLCTSNPDVINLVAQRVLEGWRKTPYAQMSSISPNDGGDYCECERCRALDDPENRTADGKVSLTDRFLTFYNAVAEKTSREFPGNHLGCLIYWGDNLPPRRVKPHRNLALVLVMNDAYKCMTREQWDKDRRLIEAWGRLHSPMFWYDIFADANFGFPHPITRHLVERLRVFHRAGYVGGYSYAPPAYELTGPDTFLLCRLQWDINADCDALIRQFYADMYGLAAPSVRQYYETIERRLIDVARKGPSRDLPAAKYWRSQGWQKEPFAHLLETYEPVRQRLRGLLSHAAQATKDEKVRRRLGRLWLLQSLMESTLDGLVAAADFEKDPRPDNAALPAFKKAVEAREEALGQLEKGFGATLVPWIHGGDAYLGNPVRATYAAYAISRAAEVKRIQAVRTQQPVVVDGKADEPVWATASKNELQENMSGAPAKAQSHVALTFDKDSLYCFVRGEEPSAGKLLARNRPSDDGGLFDDDNVEVFLDTTLDHKSYFHLAVNPVNSRYDARAAEPGKDEATWNGAWRSAVLIDAQGLNVELAVPFAGLGIPAPREGDRWGLLITRTRRGAADPDEYQSIYPTLGGFHVPQKFALLMFGKGPDRGTNLQPGGDFEDLPLGPLADSPRLRVGGKGSFRAEVCAEPALGKRSLHLSLGDDAQDASIAFPGVNITQSTTHRLTFRYRISGVKASADGSRKAITSRVIFGYIPGAPERGTKDYSWFSLDLSPGLKGWATFTHVFASPPAANWLYITLFIGQPGDYWIDDVKLEEM